MNLIHRITYTHASHIHAHVNSIMRPFLLRRLKKDVAKQLPGKFEHVVMCKLSKRQLYLYEEYMSVRITTFTLEFSCMINYGTYVALIYLAPQT